MQTLQAVREHLLSTSSRSCPGIIHSCMPAIMMSFRILTLQSARYLILTIALRLFFLAEIIDKHCMRLSHQPARPGISTSQTASSSPALDDGRDSQAEPLPIPVTPKRLPEPHHGHTDSSTSTDSPLLSTDNSGLASNSSSCASISSTASTPERKLKSIIPLAQHHSSAATAANEATAAECSKCLADGGDIRGLSAQGNHIIDEGVGANEVSSSGASVKRPIFPPNGTLTTHYAPTVEKDTTPSHITKAYQWITFMPVYELYSFEALPLANEDTSKVKQNHDTRIDDNTGRGLLVHLLRNKSSQDQGYQCGDACNHREIECVEERLSKHKADSWRWS